MLNHHTMMIHCLIYFNEAMTIIYQDNGRMKSIEINSFFISRNSFSLYRSLHGFIWIITIYSVTTRYNNISQCLHFIYFLLFPFTVTAENTARVLPNIKSIFHRFRSITEARIRGVASLISMCVCNADLFLITFFNEILWTNPRGLKFNSMHRHQMLYINRSWTSTKKDAIGICL